MDARNCLCGMFRQYRLYVYQTINIKHAHGLRRRITTRPAEHESAFRELVSLVGNIFNGLYIQLSLITKRLSCDPLAQQCQQLLSVVYAPFVFEPLLQ